MLNFGLRWPLTLFVLGLACITREVPDDGAASDADNPDVGTTDARETAPKLPPPTRKDLGQACSASGDCASGFCVDSVCCDSACDATCFACDISGSAGRCSGLENVEDPAGVPPCTVSGTCTKNSSGVTACRLKDGEPCAGPDDCASGYCRSYYRDQDGDGYGAESPDTIVRCDGTPRPPAGFSASQGDCCDTDPGAKPGIVTYFTTRNRCGSFDWNCRNGDEKQSNGACPTSGGAALACGQACSIVLKGTSGVLFVQSCH